MANTQKSKSHEIQKIILSYFKFYRSENYFPEATKPLFVKKIISCVTIFLEALGNCPSCGSMKYLVVYYSRTGNNKTIGDTIAQSLSADVDVIIDKK